MPIGPPSMVKACTSVVSWGVRGLGRIQRRMIERGDPVGLHHGVIDRACGRGQCCDQRQADGQDDDEHVVRGQSTVQAHGQPCQGPPGRAGPGRQVAVANEALIGTLVQSGVGDGIVGRRWTSPRP